MGYVTESGGKCLKLADCGWNCRLVSIGVRRRSWVWKLL